MASVSASPSRLSLSPPLSPSLLLSKPHLQSHRILDLSNPNKLENLTLTLPVAPPAPSLSSTPRSEE